MRETEELCGQFSEILNSLVRKLINLNKEEKICCGVNMSQCYTIETLSDRGRMAMSELSQELGIAVSTLTRSCDILVRDGIVSRVTNPDDRRQVLIELTPQGKEIEKKLKACSDNYCGKVFGNIPAEHRTGVVHSLILLSEAIEQTRAGEADCCKDFCTGELNQ